MAYIEGRWLDRPEREERIKLLKEKLRKIADIIRSGRASDHHYDLLEKDKAELEKCLRVHRAETDHLYFFYEYFSEARNSGNPDNLVPTADYDMNDAPEFHQKLSNILDSVSNFNTSASVAWSASRGHAKSAYLSNSFPTRELCFRKRKMVLIISETLPGSAKFLRWISGQLKFNLKLREDFGVILHEDSNKNVKDSQDQFITTTGAMLACSSLGKQIRGIRNGSQRPDCIIMDDLESKESCNTMELIMKHRDWLNQECIPAKAPEACILFMGTMVHPSSLLNYVLTEKPEFIKNKFPAIIDYPERMDLWDEFCRIFKDYVPTEKELQEYENATRKMESPNEKASMDFYRSQKAEMDKGAKVLWEKRFPLHQLFMQKVSLGSKAFATEFMNTAIDEETAIFKENKFHFYDPATLQFNHERFRIVMAIDFALGKERGDYSALTVMAEDKLTKKKYIIDSYAKRIVPDDFIKDIIKYVLKWQPSMIAVEAVAAQEFFATTLQRELQNHGYPAYSRVKKIYQKSRKSLRIESLAIPIEEGEILFNPNFQMMLQQFIEYPNGHDDILDSVEMCFSALKQSQSKAVVKQSWM